LEEWRRLLRASTTQARTVLHRVLRGRITFTPRVNDISGELDGYEFEAPTCFDKLFTGIAVECPKSLVPGDVTGCENIGPEDTLDGDYGRPIDWFFEKGGGPYGTVFANLKKVAKRLDANPKLERLGQRQIEITEVADSWLAPDHRYFKKQAPPRQ
jgi:hypothetical protein